MRKERKSVHRMRKRSIFIVLVIFIFFILSILVKSYDIKNGGENGIKIQKREEISFIKEDVESYMELLVNYDRAIHDSSYRWEVGKVFDQNKVYYQAIYHVEKDEGLVYAITDLAEDGEPELLIGNHENDYRICNPFIIYGCIKGEIKEFVTFEYPMSLYKGGIIEINAGKGMYEDISYLRMQKNSLETETIVNLWADRVDIKSDEYIYYADGVEISKEEFEDMRKELTNQSLEIDWQPLEGFWQGE